MYAPGVCVCVCVCLFIKRLIPVLDSDWSAAVVYSQYSTAMTASPNHHP